MARVIVFIDNSNVYRNICNEQRINPNAWCKQYNPSFLAQKLAGNRQLVGVFFYCSPPPPQLQQQSPASYASQNSYYSRVAALSMTTVKYGTLTFNSGVPSEKNLDTQLTSDVVVMAATNAYDHAIIVTNDGDFVAAIDGAKTLGKKVEVAHFKARMSMNLKTTADITRRLRPSYFVYLQ